MCVYCDENMYITSGIYSGVIGGRGCRAAADEWRAAQADERDWKQGADHWEPGERAQDCQRHCRRQVSLCVLSLVSCNLSACLGVCPSFLTSRDCWLQEILSKWSGKCLSACLPICLLVSSFQSPSYLTICDSGLQVTQSEGSGEEAVVFLSDYLRCAILLSFFQKNSSIFLVNR